MSETSEKNKNNLGKWIQDDTIEMPVRGMGTVTVTDHFELLPDASTVKQFEGFNQEREEFFEWFEKEQHKLEENYHNNSGESKIKAANELIKLILTARGRWDEVNTFIFNGGTWNGFEKSTCTMNTIKFNLDYSCDMTLQISKPSTKGGPSQATGTISNGIANLNAMGGLVKLNSTFRGELSGYAFDGKLFLIITQCLQNLKLNALGGLGTSSIGSVGMGSRQGTEGYKKYKGLVKILNTEVPISPITIKCSETKREIKDIVFSDFKSDKLLEKYFSWLVRTTDEVRTTIYHSKAPSGQMKVSIDTHREFLHLLSKAQSLGVPSSLQSDLGLVNDTETSLYDKWFRMWYTSGRKFWKENVSSNPTVRIYREQFYFMLEAAERRIPQIISQKPFDDYKITYQGDEIDAVFADYYNYTIQRWLSQVKRNRNSVDSAIRWVYEMYTYIITGCVSVEMGDNLGLTSYPPTGQIQLNEAAGNKEVQ